MKSGFRDTLDYILTTHGMRTRNVVGTVVGGPQNKTRVYLRDTGYRVERGLRQPNYDFIYISNRFSTFEMINKCLTKVRNGCIIIFRVNDNTAKVYYADKYLYYLPSLYEFAPSSYFGVIVKGTRHEGKS